jgi:hypothetical protein
MNFMMVLVTISGTQWLEDVLIIEELITIIY